MSKTAVIYARFSCSKQREASIEDQQRVCREWCGREGYEVVAEYSDYAISGRTDDRPEFQRMIANAGESDIVLVYMMDRFSRDEFDAPIYKRELARKGVKLVSAMESIPDSPEGIIYEKLLEGLAACESRKTSIRSRRGMEGNALKCLTNGVRVYGYGADENDRYRVVPEEAAIVREAFARRLQGEAVNSIARDFAQRGVTTRTGRPCGYTMVYSMLTNEKYTGKYSWGGIEQDGGMPQIVDRETFRRCRGVKGKKQRANESWGDFALSGKAVCGCCGHNLQGVSGHSHTGSKYEYYDCRRCGLKAVRRDWLEGEVVSRIRELLADDAEAMRVALLVRDAAERRQSEGLERKHAEASLRQAETGLQNIMSAIEQGIIHPQAKQRIGELEAQKERAEHDLAALKLDVPDPATFVRFLQRGATLTDKAVIEAFVWQVLVTDEQVITTLNYDNEKGEPSRFTIERVLTKLEWCTVSKTSRTFLAVQGGTVYLRFDRAA